MLKKIFLILSGEDENKRPRSKKLLELIRISNLREDEYKIVISGLASFSFNVKESEAKRMSDFIIKRNIPLQNIILEEESIDTLGNMVFSHKIIEKLVRLNNSYSLDIILITEGFHMTRSKKLFFKICLDLKNLNPNINFIFESANTKGISSYFWKRKLNIISHKFKNNLEYGKDVSEYLEKIFLLDKKYAFDFIIMDFILTDIDFFKLKIYSDFENYMYSLPIYKEKYKDKESRKFVQYGFYANLIKSNQFLKTLKENRLK